MTLSAPSWWGVGWEGHLFRHTRVGGILWEPSPHSQSTVLHAKLLCSSISHPLRWWWHFALSPGISRGLCAFSNISSSHPCEFRGKHCFLREDGVYLEIRRIYSCFKTRIVRNRMQNWHNCSRRSTVIKTCHGRQCNHSDTVIMDTCHYTSVKTHRMYNTKSEPECQLWSLGDDNVSMRVHQL